jgi:alpha-N-acetylglucosaminidase
VSQDRWRYFLNYCCFGYSLPWYDWTQWEQLIDWMALNGVNAPLSVTGQEAVWLAAGRRLGFTESDLQAFLAGPPYCRSAGWGAWMVGVGRCQRPGPSATRSCSRKSSRGNAPSE